MAIMVRVEVTAEEWKALRVRAAELDMPVQRMMRAALETSHITRQAFQAKEDTSK